MFDQSIIDAAKAHALAEYPKESCGVVSGGTYIPCENVAEEPTKNFAIATEILATYIIGQTLQAVIHSHPHEHFSGKSSPSRSDMQGQLDTAVIWGVIDTDGKIATDPWWFGDGALDEPLLGREFQHGVRDCYSIIRAWYWQKKGIALPEFPRDDQWWKDGGNLYALGFETAGFRRISKSELQDGDVVLLKFRSPKYINHGGIYLDNREDGRSVFLHHLPHRLSCRVAAGPWTHGAELFLRYEHAA